MFPINNCRICEKQSNLIDISINPNYIEQYLIIGNVSYDANDGLPQFFCRFCITQLLHFVKFKQKCNETYNKFQDLLMQTKIKEELNYHDEENIWHYQGEDISEYSEYTKTETSNHLTLNDNDDNNDLLTVLSYEIIDLNEVSSADSEDKIKNQKSKEVSSNKLGRLNTKTQNPYQCECCDKRFLHKHHLVEHKRIHTGEKPYKCDICNTSFSRKHTLNEHTRIHTGERPFKCAFCNNCFSRKQTLVLHTKRHIEKKPYKCEICDLYFASKGTLVRHARKHSSENPYKL